jgi:hypothetical protein
VATRPLSARFQLPRLCFDSEPLSLDHVTWSDVLAATCAVPSELTRGTDEEAEPIQAHKAMTP